MSRHYCCPSAGTVLSPAAEALQWEDSTQGDSTEQRGSRWEPATAEPPHREAGEQSKSSIKARGRKQTWSDPRRWSSLCASSQRWSQWSSRWMNHICSDVSIHFISIWADESVSPVKHASCLVLAERDSERHLSVLIRLSVINVKLLALYSSR